MEKSNIRAAIKWFHRVSDRERQMLSKIINEPIHWHTFCCRLARIQNQLKWLGGLNFARQRYKIRRFCHNIKLKNSHVSTESKPNQQQQENIVLSWAEARKCFNCPRKLFSIRQAEYQCQCLNKTFKVPRMFFFWSSYSLEYPTVVRLNYAILRGFLSFISVCSKSSHFEAQTYLPRMNRQGKMQHIN